MESLFIDNHITQYSPNNQLVLFSYDESIDKTEIDLITTLCLAG